MIQCQWLMNSPYYTYSEKKGLQRNGSFKNSRSWTTSFYNFLFKTVKFYKYTGMNFPSLSNADKELSCQIVKAIQSEIMLNFPKTEFIAIADHLGKSAEMIKCFIKIGVRYVVPQLISEKNDTIPVDGHPTATLNKKIAKWLTKELNLSQLPNQ